MTNNKKRLLVSVGMPVYNEEKYLEKTLDSIISQFKNSIFDYEIIIADNASTDSTGDIIRKYAKKYSRIKYIRNKQNIYSIESINKLIRLSKGKYFMLAAGHDLWSKNYISSCLNVMEEDKEVVLAYPKTIWIDENGKKLKRKLGFIDTRGDHVYSRFNLTIWANPNAIYGLIRSSALKKTRLMRQIIAGDYILLGELALLGEFAHVPTEAWYRRKNRDDESLEQRLKRYNNHIFSQRKGISSKLRHWKIPCEYMHIIWNSDMTFKNKIHLMLVTLPVIFLRYLHEMIHDLRHILS